MHYYYRDYDYFHKFIHTLRHLKVIWGASFNQITHKKKEKEETNDCLWLMPYFLKLIL